MFPRALAWLFPLPLVAAVGLAAHALGYRAVAASPAGHAHSLDPVAHGTGAWYVCAALCGATALVALAGIALVSARRGTALRAPLWLVALVPPLGFTAQEELGRLLHTGASLPVEATFLFGLLLQIPVALLALLLVRALLRTAAVLVGSLSSRKPLRRATRITVARPGWLDLAPSFPALALGYGERGPPALLLP
jgi:hypothetical protein